MTTDLAYHDRLCANFLSLDGSDIWALTVLDEMRVGGLCSKESFDIQASGSS